MPHLTFLPYPHYFKGEAYDGVRIKWPARCNACSSKQCLDNFTTELKICSYGFNYIWLGRDLLISGIVVKGFMPATPAYTKQAKSMRKLLVNKEDITTAIKTLENIDKKEAVDIEKGKKAILEEYRKKQLFNKEILAEINERVIKAFSTLHDYKHFVSMVSQNMNVILETRYQGEGIDEKIDQALHAEKSIYFASKMMAEILNVNLYITNPETIFDASRITKFKLYGLLLKYLRIYQMAFDEKKIEVSVIGKSNGKVLGNPGAIGVILHTFINNALKYSQSGSKVKIFFNEDSNIITLSVESYGPHISSSEREKIFEPFYRGKDAQQFKEEGTGFGLYASQFIAHELGTSISVEQPDKETPNGYRTTFSVSFNREE